MCVHAWSSYVCVCVCARHHFIVFTDIYHHSIALSPLQQFLESPSLSSLSEMHLCTSYMLPTTAAHAQQWW